jgi:prevent-host-death family protein
VDGTARRRLISRDFSWTVLLEVYHNSQSVNQTVGIMRDIGAFEAKSKFGQLLDWVEAGEEIIITWRGKIVARLVQPDAAYDRKRAIEAAARIRARRRGLTLGGLKTKDLVNEGRL